MVSSGRELGDVGWDAGVVVDLDVGVALVVVADDDPASPLQPVTRQATIVVTMASTDRNSITPTTAYRPYTSAYGENSWVLMTMLNERGRRSGSSTHKCDMTRQVSPAEAHSIVNATPLSGPNYNTSRDVTRRSR